MYKPLFMKREVIVFRQFQRKGYSLFACLGREVVISVLSVATLSSATAATTSEQDLHTTDSARTVQERWLDDIGITGSRAPLTQSRAARMVTVLSHDDIAQAAVQSVNDLLKMAVGVDVRQRGHLGSQTDISIRGGTQEQIAVLLNGINTCDPQTGHNVMDLPCQLNEIVRVEVLEGPAGRTYGTSSLVGAINIVTRPARHTGATVEVEGGSFGYAKMAARANLHQGRWNNQLSGSCQRSDGFSRSKAGTLNTDYSGKKGFYQGQYDDSTVSVSWHLGIADKGWGSSTFYASPRWQADDQYEHTTKLFTAIQAETKQGTIHLRPSIYWQQHRDRYEGYRGRPDKMKYNYNRCDVYGVGLNSWIDWAAGRTALGAELRNEDLVSGNLGEPLTRTQHISGTDRDYTLGINRTNIAAHLEHNILLHKLTVSAGFVAVKNSWSSMNMTLYPGIDASYRLIEDIAAARSLKAFASWNTSLRLPSFTEMYYKLQGYAADPHLKPEEMQAVEVGAQYLSPSVQARLSLFHHQGKNMIDWIMDTALGEKAEWRSVNHTKINSYGLESYVAIDLKKMFPSQDIVRSLSLSYSYMDQDKSPGAGIVSQYALEYLKHKLTASVQMHLYDKLHLGINSRWQDRVGSYTNFDGDVCDYRPFLLVDTRLAWNDRHYTVYAQANNLLDNRDYVDYGNVPQPGIQLSVGLVCRF